MGRSASEVETDSFVTLSGGPGGPGGPPKRARNLVSGEFGIDVREEAGITGGLAVLAECFKEPWVGVVEEVTDGGRMSLSGGPPRVVQASVDATTGGKGLRSSKSCARSELAMERSAVEVAVGGFVTLTGGPGGSPERIERIDRVGSSGDAGLGTGELAARAACSSEMTKGIDGVPPACQANSA